VLQRIDTTALSIIILCLQKPNNNATNGLSVLTFLVCKNYLSKMGVCVCVRACSHLTRVCEWV